MTAHAKTVRAALRAGDEIERLIARLGTAEHPRGAVLSAYRNAERGLRDALHPATSRQMAQRAAAEVLGGLRRDVGATVRETLSEAAAAGRQAARVQAAAQGLDVGATALNDFGAGQADVEGPAAAWLAVVEVQIAAALALAGADEAELGGDEQRAGVLRPAVVVAEGSRWLAGALNSALVAYWLWLQGRASGGARETWYHQAVAAIDERTTDCCLRVHGQVQRLDKPFKLTGTPRYANELDHPPFHWYCRSAEAILTAEQARDELTQEMVDAARAELVARKDKSRVEIHPADARSRR
jgi:hypothetical protein